MMRKFLKPYEDPNSHTLTAAWKVTSNCTELIRTLPMLIHDETHVEDVDTKGDDHAYDSNRYGLLNFGVSPPSGQAGIRDLQQKMLKTQEKSDKAKYRPDRGRSDNILTAQF